MYVSSCSAGCSFNPGNVACSITTCGISICHSCCCVPGVAAGGPCRTLGVADIAGVATGTSPLTFASGSELSSDVPYCTQECWRLVPSQFTSVVSPLVHTPSVRHTVPPRRRRRARGSSISLLLCTIRAAPCDAPFHGDPISGQHSALRDAARPSAFGVAGLIGIGNSATDDGGVPCHLPDDVLLNRSR